MLPFIHRGSDQPGPLAQALTELARAPKLAPLPHNTNHGAAGYLCIAPADWRDADPETLADIRAGRCVLLLDQSDHAPSASSGASNLATPDCATLETILDWIEANSLPAGRVILATANLALPARARAHLGLRAHILRLACFDARARAVAWHFSPHSPSPRLGTDPDAAIAAQRDPAGPRRLLRCHPAAATPHALLAIAALRHHALADYAFLTPPAATPADLAAAHAFAQAHPPLHYLRPALDTLPEPQDRPTSPGLPTDPAETAQSHFSITAQPDFSAGAIRTTDAATLEAFALGHPCIPLASPGTLDAIAALGLHDGAGPLDRRADAIAAPGPRFEAALREILRQALRARATPQAWHAAMAEHTAHNIRHAVSGALFAACETRFDTPLLQTLDRLLHRNAAAPATCPPPLDAEATT